MKNVLKLCAIAGSLISAQSSYACAGSGTVTMNISEGKPVAVLNIMDGKLTTEKGYTLSYLTTNLDLAENEVEVLCDEAGEESALCSDYATGTNQYTGGTIYEVITADYFSETRQDLEVVIADVDGNTTTFNLLETWIDPNQPRSRGGCGADVAPTVAEDAVEAAE